MAKQLGHPPSTRTQVIISSFTASVPSTSSWGNGLWTILNIEPEQKTIANTLYIERHMAVAIAFAKWDVTAGKPTISTCCYRDSTD